MAGLLFLVMVVCCAVFAPVITIFDPNRGDLRSVRMPPQGGHWLGTDGGGRDVWARLLYGSRVSIAVGTVAVTISTVIGVLLGSIAGFFSGKIDAAIMRFTDIILCFPTLLVILTLVTVLGPSVLNVMLVIGGFSWPTMCRLVRSQFLSLRQQDFVLAARATGSSTSRIITRYMLPNVAAPVLVLVTLGLASAILTEAGLSFLGLSVSIPTPSWGNMLFDATSISVMENNWWLWIPPGFLIALTVIAINFVGDGLRDAFDSRMLID